MNHASCPWILLALEAERVIELRLVRLAWGGSAAWSEVQLMTSEKIAAAIEAMGMLMTGSTPERVVTRYREHVAANMKRLSTH